MTFIAFSGDLSLTGCFAEPSWVPSQIDTSITDFLGEADHVVLNLEGPITSEARLPAARGTRLSSPRSAWAAVERLNCSVLNLANNHVLDCGVPGLQDTIREAEGRGISWHGVGRNLAEAIQPLVLDISRVSLGLIAFTVDVGQSPNHGDWGTSSGPPRETIQSAISTARQQTDVVIVQYHGGEEFVPLPSRRQIHLLRKFVDWGADVVICHHSHVVQPWERYEDGLIFYGLGNLIFDHRGHWAYPGTQDSAIVRLDLSHGAFSFDVLRTHADRRTGVVSKIQTQPDLPYLALDRYRRRYSRAVYDTHFWPGVDRDASGTPNKAALKQIRRPFIERITSWSRWRRLFTRDGIRKRLIMLEHLFWLRFGTVPDGETAESTQPPGSEDPDRSRPDQRELRRR